MTDERLSELEAAVFRALHEAHREIGFPSPSKVHVLARRNTGAGRVVDVESEERIKIADGFLDLGERYIEMLGVPNGLMAVVAIEHGRVLQLEIAAFGDQCWDGVEREWRLV
ncbi:MAG: hypothetical protein ACK59M_02385 [Pseudomonadota bacterium]|jgi:hypothetical protein